MDSPKKLQKRLDKVFENGALFTYELKPGSATLIASKAWALQEYKDTVLVGVVFATASRHWIHRIIDVKQTSEALILTTSENRKVELHPLNTGVVSPSILEFIKNDDRIKEELEEEVESILEANPHINLGKF